MASLCAPHRLLLASYLDFLESRRFRRWCRVNPSPVELSADLAWEFLALWEHAGMSGRFVLEFKGADGAIFDPKAGMNPLDCSFSKSCMSVEAGT